MRNYSDLEIENWKHNYDLKTDPVYARNFWISFLTVFFIFPVAVMFILGGLERIMPSSGGSSGDSRVCDHMGCWRE